MRKFKGTALLLLSLCFTITALAQTSINIVSLTVKNQLPGSVDTWGMIPASLVLVAQVVQHRAKDHHKTIVLPLLPE